ncbi:hypothetical protein [Longibacter salinarum]|uniref:hypothetical protein n=1 Tax=Longibacter salinarum TaxID=1850348 RepID=UPI0011812C2C|nr:hypothetical protein [Longibacter salinarum]
MTISRLFTRSLLAVAVALPLLVGCSTSKTDTFEVADIARFSLPFERDVPSHPDSLRYVSVVEKERTVEIQSEKSYRGLTRDWSATRRNALQRRGVGRVSDYATLWGMDLSILSLQVEMGISGLTKDRALQLVEQRKNETRNEIQIDVYWFAPANASTVPGPNTDAEIRIDDGTRYDATRSDYGPIRDSFLPDGQRVLYRRNSFFFKRIQDEKDILANTQSLRMDVNRFGQGIDDTFIWTWEEAMEEQAQAANGASE